MVTTLKKFNLSRKEAAEILEISMRTLDRYIRKGDLASRKRGGTVLLNEEDVSNFRVVKFQTLHGKSPDGPGRVHRHVDSVASRTIIDADTGEVEDAVLVNQGKELKTERDQVFEELYHLTQQELRTKQSQLEAAQYKLGQTEVQLKHTVPLLEFQSQTEALKEKEQKVEQRMKHQEKSIEVLEEELSAERLNKNVYVGLLFGLLALQPLIWLFLQN